MVRSFQNVKLTFKSDSEITWHWLCHGRLTLADYRESLTAGLLPSYLIFTQLLGFEKSSFSLDAIEIYVEKNYSHYNIISCSRLVAQRAGCNVQIKVVGNNNILPLVVHWKPLKRCWMKKKFCLNSKQFGRKVWSFMRQQWMLLLISSDDGSAAHQRCQVNINLPYLKKIFSGIEYSLSSINFNFFGDKISIPWNSRCDIMCRT